MLKTILISIVCLTAILLPVGIYMVSAYLFQFPTLTARRLAKKSKKLGQKIPSGFDVLTEKLAVLVVDKIHYDKLARQEMLVALDGIDSPISPEMHAAKSIIFGLLFFVIAFPFFFVSKIMGFVVLAAGAGIAVFKYRSPLIKLKKLRAGMEREIPRFAATIAEGLKTERNVLKLLIGYREVAGKTFGKELDKTIADMKSSNYESALLRFDYRISSPYLSDVIKGLLGAIRGDDQTTYFNILCVNLKAHEKAMLMENARKRPAKINRASLSMLLALIVLYVVVLGTVIMESLAIFNF